MPLMRRRLALLLLLTAFPVSGCDCLFGILGGIPFETESEGTVVFPLGAVGDCTANDDGTVPEDGEPDDSGSLTVYSHTNDGTACTLKADWIGTLVDMESVRADVDAELEEAGVDPASVVLSITTMTPSVETIVLRDDETDDPIEMQEGALLGYRGSISVEGDDDIIVATYEGDGDPTVPDVAISESPTLVELANIAYADGTDLRASGAGNTRIAMDQLTDIQGAERPALAITFAITVVGTAALGGE